MTREEVQKVIEDGGYLFNEAYDIVFKPESYSPDANMLPFKGMNYNKHGATYQDFWACKNSEWRIATQEEINQYVNGTDKQS